MGPIAGSVPALRRDVIVLGGFYGRLVSGVLWLASASLAVWSSPRAAIAMLVLGGFFIYPLTELFVRLGGETDVLSPTNSFRHLGMQVAFVLPLSMPLLIPVTLYRWNWFYPGLMILLGAHYPPFVTLYGMRMFAVLAGVGKASAEHQWRAGAAQQGAATDAAPRHH